MAVNEKTSPKVAKIASKILGYLGRKDCPVDGLVLVPAGKSVMWVCKVAELKALAASALTQTKDKPKKK